MVKLSVLDLAYIGEGFTPADALHNAVDLARHAEAAGYERFWLAAHHNLAGLASAEGMLGGALGRRFALSEAYPDLKANENMSNLQEELSSTENKVSFSRQAFNDAVTAYNTYKQTFPPVFFAGMFGHGQDATLLEFESQKIKEAPKGQF